MARPRQNKPIHYYTDIFSFKITNSPTNVNKKPFAVMGKVAGYSVIVRLNIEMTGKNAERAGHYDRHSFRKVKSIIFETNNIIHVYKIIIILMHSLCNSRIPSNPTRLSTQCVLKVKLFVVSQLLGPRSCGWGPMDLDHLSVLPFITSSARYMQNFKKIYTLPKQNIPAETITRL